MLDLLVALGDWFGGILEALKRFWNRASGAGTQSREADGRANARMRTHGMRSKPMKEDDR
jgi:hypothetical protein